MKRALFYTGLVLVSAVCTARISFAKSPGGVFPEETRQKTTSILERAYNGGINVALGMESPNDPHAITDPEFYQGTIQDAYNNWFKGSAEQIKRANRENEFADVYGRLQQGVKVGFSGKPDLNVVVVPRDQIKAKCHGDDSTQACVNFEGSHPVMYVAYASKKDNKSQRKSYQATITHETGHTLGFTDQYPTHNRQAADAERSSSQWDEKSIMNGGGLGENHNVSARDATTLINQLDAEGLSGNARKGKEWASLDKNDSDRYKDGKRMGSENETRIVRESGSQWSLTTPGGTKRTYSVSPNAQFQSVSELMDAQIQITKKDGKGNPVEGKDQYGHKVIYSNFQDYQTRMFFAGNNLVAVDQTRKGQWGDEYIAQVGVNGKTEEIKGEFSPVLNKAYFYYNDHGKKVELPPCSKKKVSECTQQAIKKYNECRASGKTLEECSAAKKKKKDSKAESSGGSSSSQATRPDTGGNGQNSGAQVSQSQARGKSTAGTKRQNTRRQNTGTQTRSSAGTQTRSNRSAQSKSRNNGVVGAASTRYAQGNGGNQIVGVAR